MPRGGGVVDGGGVRYPKFEMFVMQTRAMMGGNF